MYTTFKKLLFAFFILSLTSCLAFLDSKEITQEYIYYFSDTLTEFTVNGKSKDYFTYSIYINYSFQLIGEESVGSFGPFGLGEPSTGITEIYPYRALVDQPNEIILKRVVDNVEFIIDFSKFNFNKKTDGNAGIGFNKLKDIDRLIEEYDRPFVTNFTSFEFSPEKYSMKKEGARVTNICIDPDKLFAVIDSNPNTSNRITIRLPRDPYDTEFN